MVIRYLHKGVYYIAFEFVEHEGNEYQVNYACKFKRLDEGKEVIDTDWGLVPKDDKLKTLRINEL